MATPASALPQLTTPLAGLVDAADGLYRLSLDGSLAVRLFPRNDEAGQAIFLKAAPGAGRAAFVTAEDPALNGLALYLVSLPDGTVEKITPLIPEAFILQEDADFGSPYFEAVRAIYAEDSLAWSPDAQRLYFTAALDGDSANLYVYDLGQKTIDRLSDEPYEAYHPVLSPDGRYLAYTEVESFGTGAGLAVQGVWVLDLQEQRSIWLGKARYTLGEDVQGWLTPDIVLVSSWMDSCGKHNLRAVSVRTKAETVVWPEYFSRLAHNPLNGAYLLAVEDYGADCNPSLSRGVFRFDAHRLTPEKVLDDADPYIAAAPGLGGFFARSAAGVYLLLPESEPQRLDFSPSLLPAPGSGVPAAGGACWAWGGGERDDTQGVWVRCSTEAVDQNAAARQVFDQPVTMARVSPDGQTILFASRGRMYRAQPPEYTPQPVEGLQFAEWAEVDITWIYP